MDWKFAVSRPEVCATCRADFRPAMPPTSGRLAVLENAEAKNPEGFAAFTRPEEVAVSAPSGAARIIAEFHRTSPLASTIQASCSPRFFFDESAGLLVLLPQPCSRLELRKASAAVRCG